jgi:hypothetical protein
VSALYFNTSGVSNTASGHKALYENQTGIYNEASGADALTANTTGNANTADGAYALSANTTGDNNIAIGFAAGTNIYTGYNNIVIGNAGLSTDNNVIRIGTTDVQTKTFIAGISGATVATGAAVLVNSLGQLGVATSSEKFKRDIQTMGDASDVLLSLRPVTFRYKPELDPAGAAQFGLVAEEVGKVDPDLVLRDDKNKIYTVRYEAINAMLLNEFLKQHRKVEKQQEEIQSLRDKVSKMESLEERLAVLEQLLLSGSRGKRGDLQASTQ